MITVVAPQHDNGLVREAKPLQFFQHTAHLRVQVTDVGKVAVTDFAHRRLT